MRISIFLFIIFLLFLSSFSQSEARISRKQLLAAYVFRIIDHIHWPSKKEPHNLYVFDDGKGGYESFLEASLLKSNLKKKIVVHKINQLTNLNAAQIIFIPRESNLNYQDIYKKTDSSPVLLISDRIDDDRYALIDIQNKSNKQLIFKINKSNVLHRNLKIDPEIIFLGGTEIDIAHLYKKGQADSHKKIKKINDLKKQFIRHKKNSDQTLNNLKLAENKIISRNQTINNQTKKIESQQLKIKTQQSFVDQLITKTNTQKIAIKENSIRLEQKELTLDSLQSQISKSVSTLAQQKINIAEQNNRIERQYSNINKQKKLIDEHAFTIATQKDSIALIAFSLIISMFLVFISYFAYRHKKISNDKLQQYAINLTKAKQEAEIYANTKSTFLSCMSHELRSPLTSIIGFSEMMKSDPSFSDEIKNNIAVINRSGEHLLGIINDILDLAKIESGQVEFNNEIISLETLCNDIINMFRVGADNKQLYLNLDFNLSCQPFIFTDITKLRRLLINLVSNAIKFTSEGGVTIHVHCFPSSHKAQTKLEIKVEDTGIGILVEDQDKIFKPFKQASIIQNTKWQTGTGLGLSICKQLVELMGGKLQLKSIPGKGSIFYFSILVGTVEEQESLRICTNQAEIIGFEPMTPINILIVEDLEDSAKYLTQVLKTSGCSTSTAENGKQAILAFQEIKPDLIFMDKRMPEVDGIKASQAIRRLEGGENVVIIALTASALDNIKENILDSTFNDFIQKPYLSKDIYLCLKKHLKLKLLYNKPMFTYLPTVKNMHKVISNLPESILLTLRTAILELDIEKTLSAIEKIKTENQELSVYLKGFATDFDFSSLNKLVNSE